jgi:hypothetical protein
MGGALARDRVTVEMAFEHRNQGRAMRQGIGLRTTTGFAHVDGPFD